MNVQFTDEELDKVNKFFKKEFHRSSHSIFCEDFYFTKNEYYQNNTRFTVSATFRNNPLKAEDSSLDALLNYVYYTIRSRVNDNEHVSRMYREWVDIPDPEIEYLKTKINLLENKLKELQNQTEA